MPGITTVAFGAAGFALTPMVLGKVFTDKTTKQLPKWLTGTTGLLVNAGAGVLLGGVLGKFYKRSAGAAFATGAVVGVAGTWLASKVGGLAGTPGYYDDEGLLDMAGATYADVSGVGGATYTNVSGFGADELTSLDAFGDIPEIEYGADLDDVA